MRVVAVRRDSRLVATHLFQEAVATPRMKNGMHVEKY